VSCFASDAMQNCVSVVTGVCCLRFEYPVVFVITGFPLWSIV